MDAELARMKSEISLTDYAESLGFVRDPKDSTASFDVLRYGADKLVITRDRNDGHDVYFNVHAQGDSGSIVDFAQKRLGGNLGQIRKELRAWLPGAKRPAPLRPAREPRHPVPVTHDRAAMLHRWAALEPYAGRWLTEARGIEPGVIEAFGVRQDNHGNACIPHIMGGGAVVGWEVKNDKFTGFPAGGERHLSWAKLDEVPTTCIVIGETGIDLMSYAQLHHVEGAAYVSTSGSGIGDRQRASFGKLLALGIPVIVASDADEAGDKFAAELAAMAPAGADIQRARPPVPPGQTGKVDWNDVLMTRIAAQQARERSNRPLTHNRHTPGF